MDKKEAAEQLASCQIKIKEYTEEYIKLCEKTFGKEKTAERLKLLENMDQEELNNLSQRSMDFTQSLIKAINCNLAEDSPEVQRLIFEHLEICSRFAPMTKKDYQLSMKCLCKESDFYSGYQKMCPRLPEFLHKAMEIFLKNDMKAL